MEFREDPGCLTLSEDMMDERDFKAGEAIELDLDLPLPDHYSLGERVYKTNYQNGRGSCTSNATSHAVQVLSVIANKEKPTKENIITPKWKDLRTKMGHDLSNINDSGDYVEKAVNVALKQGVENEEGGVSKFDGFCYGSWDCTDKSIELMKRYLYNGNPIVRCLRGNQTTWNELSKGQLKTFIDVAKRTGGHAVCLVGWDNGGFRFINSRRTNDGKGFKSRFYVTYADMKKLGGTFNWRYWILYNKQDAKKSPEYLKRKNTALILLKALRSIYDTETLKVKKEIVDLSLSLREEYPELNEEYPVE